MEKWVSYSILKFSILSDNQKQDSVVDSRLPTAFTASHLTMATSRHTTSMRPITSNTLTHHSYGPLTLAGASCDPAIVHQKSQYSPPPDFVQLSWVADF